MITTVLIDIDDTLLDFNESAREAMENVMLTEGLFYTTEVFKTFLEVNSALWKKIEDGSLTKKELFDIRWCLIFERLGISFDGKHFDDLFREELCNCAAAVPYAKELLEYLSGKYKLHAASNALLAQQKKRLTKAGLLGYIDKMFMPENIGFFKPSKEFFDACMALLPDTDKQEIIIIGDSASADINGGADYGFKTCWLNRGGCSANGVRADYTVGSLKEIIDIL